MDAIQQMITDKVFLTELAALAQRSGSFPAKPTFELNGLGQVLKRWIRDAEDEWRRLRPEWLEELLAVEIGYLEPLRRSRSETDITQMLAWLLNPVERHGFGEQFLSAVLFGLGRKNLEKNCHFVSSEFYLLPTNDRIDIFAKGGEGLKSWVLLIEAKVDADEGDKQLERYSKWVVEHFPTAEHLCVFLTPTGRLPDTAPESWRSVSFMQLIFWVAPKLYELKQSPGFTIAWHFLAGLAQEICGLGRCAKGGVPNELFSTLSLIKQHATVIQ